MTRSVACLSLAFTVAVWAPQAGAQQRGMTRALASATFDSVWARVDRTFYDTLFLATRWRVLRDSLRPVAARAKTNAQLRAVLQTLLSSVGVSHFGLIPSEVSPRLDEASGGTDGGESSEPGTIGVSLRLANDTLVAWKVDTSGPAWARGVRPGMPVRKIDKVAIASELATLEGITNVSVRRDARLTAVMRANAMLLGSLGDTVTLVVGEGAVGRTVAIARGPVRGEMSRFGNLPPMNAVVDVSERIVATPDGPKRIGIIAFSVWLPAVAPAINRAFDRLRGADGIIVDLRGNPGGVAGMVSGVAGHMLDSAYLIGTLMQRRQALRFVANPRRVSMDAQPVVPYAGPVAIVMDPLSGSTSEFFASGLQGLGRAHVVGEVSAGRALPALMNRLPNDDVLMHVVADLTDSRGRRIEGVGVIPNEIVPLNIAALAAGRDEALDAAVRWAAHTRRGETTNGEPRTRR